MPTQREKAEAFRALHEGEPFLIPNPWDAGSARMLEALGFKALATTSAGFAFALGRLDGQVTLDDVAAHVTGCSRRRATCRSAWTSRTDSARRRRMRRGDLARGRGRRGRRLDRGLGR